MKKQEINKICDRILPIIYKDHIIDNKLYFNAFTRLKDRFNRHDTDTIRLLNDMIKSIIVNNETPETLLKLIESLCVPTWSFLKDQDINDLIKGQPP